MGFNSQYHLHYSPNYPTDYKQTNKNHQSMLCAGHLSLIFSPGAAFQRGYILEKEG